MPPEEDRPDAEKQPKATPEAKARFRKAKEEDDKEKYQDGICAGAAWLNFDAESVDAFDNLKRYEDERKMNNGFPLTADTVVETLFPKGSDNDQTTADSFFAFLDVPPSAYNNAEWMRGFVEGALAVYEDLQTAA